MKNIVYIDGTVVVERGIFYSKGIMIYAGDEFKANAEIITPPEGILRITEDYGSIFTYYYIKGDLVIYGMEDGGAVFFIDNHVRTCNLYKDNIAKIKKMIESVTPLEDIKNLFFQQQFISIFGALEYFFFNTFMRQVCNNYDAYSRVLSGHLNCLGYGKEITAILGGIHDLKQEKIFIQQTKSIVYHNTKRVSTLFSTAFGISLDIDFLTSYINTRNDIVHRFGYTKEDNEVSLTKDEVLSFMDKLNILVQKIERDLKEFNEK